MILILGTYVNGDKTSFMMEIIMMTLEKYHMLCGIHMKGVLLVTLIKFYMKALFGPVIELFYHLSSRNQYFFTLCIMVQDCMTNIYHQKNKNIFMMTGVVFSPNKRLERCTIKNINLLIQIDIMF